MMNFDDTTLRKILLLDFQPNLFCDFNLTSICSRYRTRSGTGLCREGQPLDSLRNLKTKNMKNCTTLCQVCMTPEISTNLKKKLKQIKLVQYDLKGTFANNRVRHSQQWGDDELKRGGSTKSEKTLNVSTNHNDVCIEGTSLSPVPI